MRTAGIIREEIGALALPTAILPAGVTCEAIERVFIQDADRTSVVVRHSTRAALLVDRVSFLNMMLGQHGYGRSLYHNRPVETVIDLAETLTLDAHCSASIAYDALLARPAARRFRDLVVRFPNDSFGTLQSALLLEFVAEFSAAEALRDPLTGLANRSCLIDRIGAELSRGRRSTPLGLLFIDLDRFKVVNDGLGHGAGDALLVEVADRIRSCTASGDLTARLGGDEFAVLIEGEDEAAIRRSATVCADRIRQALTTAFHIERQEVFVSASIGIAITAPGESASTLIRRGDIAMYRAKREGGGHYFFVERDDLAALKRLDMEAWLRHTIRERSLRVHFQPIVELQGGTLMGFEALVRGLHPQHGLISPDEFLPLAEEVGLLQEVDSQVLVASVDAACSWRRATDAPLYVAVNLSAASLRDESLLEEVPRVLKAAGLAPSALMLEVTEGTMLHNAQRAAKVLQTLRATGVRIAIDDFGTGYSSLTQLTTFHADTLKIDKSFVGRLRSSARDEQVVALVLALAHGMQARTVAEGIEGTEEREMLRRMGCEDGQGYLFSPACPAEEALAIAAGRQGSWRIPSVPSAAA